MNNYKRIKICFCNIKIIDIIILDIMYEKENLINEKKISAFIFCDNSCNGMFII